MSAQLEHSVRGGKGREGAQELGPEPQEALKSPRDADAPTSAGARSSRRRCHTGVPTGLARCSPPVRKGPPGPGNTGLTSLFRAIRKMQLLPSLKKDRRSWGSPGLSTPAAQARRLCACGSKPQAQIAGRAQDPGRSSRLSQPPACRLPVAPARGPPAARSPARRPLLRCLCVPATRLEALGAEPPARGAEPQILTFPTVYAKCVHSQWPLLTGARESALKPAFQAARSDKPVPGWKPLIFCKLTQNAPRCRQRSCQV